MIWPRSCYLVLFFYLIFVVVGRIYVAQYWEVHFLLYALLCSIKSEENALLSPILKLDR